MTFGTKDYLRDYGGQIKKPKGEYNLQDDCQTPLYAMTPLTPYISPKTHPVVWEPASGFGLMVKWLNLLGWESVFNSGMKIEDSNSIDADFFNTGPDYRPDKVAIQITNSPWSQKYDWIRHSLEFDIPFAVLNPSKFLFSKEGAKMIEDNDLEIIQILPRIDFFMPNRGWGGSSQLDSCWITKGLNIGQRLTYCDVTAEKKKWNAMLKASGRHVNIKHTDKNGKEKWIRIDPLADQGPLVGTPHAD